MDLEVTPDKVIGKLVARISQLEYELCLKDAGIDSLNEQLQAHENHRRERLLDVMPPYEPVPHRHVERPDPLLLDGDGG